MGPAKWQVRAVTILIVIALVWWFYPRKPPQVWWHGTAPHSSGDRAQRPTVEMPIDRDHLHTANLFVNEVAAGSEPIVLPADSEAKIRGAMELRHVPPGATLVAVQIAALSKGRTKLGMIAEGVTEAQYTQTVKTPPKTREMTVAIQFDQPWRVPDHPGELFLSVEFHLATPGVRTVPRRFAVVCPITITPKAPLP